jgi:protein-L-isoaspartate(D-aspartate) O-methyltransferase
MSIMDWTRSLGGAMIGVSRRSLVGQSVRASRRLVSCFRQYDMITAVQLQERAHDMIETQLRRRGIRDERVLEAMLRVPRHEFVPAELVEAAYEDRPLPIGNKETISQPYMVAAMTEAACVESGDRVLEVGTGSGYQAAILAYVGAQVDTIERNPRLAQEARERLERLGFRNIQVFVGDGSEGLAANAPYNLILVTAAAPSVSSALVGQLDKEGRLIVPVGDLHRQDLLLVTKHGGKTETHLLDPCQFVPLIGKGGWPENPPRFG